MSAHKTHHVYLIPGFFGFVNFGRLAYFGHVREFLDLALHAAGLRCEFHRVRVSPSASLRKRAAELAEFVAETAPTKSPIHLVGHSSGGLDARLFVSPGADLGLDESIEALAQRVRTVVTISTPHHGTPLASLFTSLLGQRALQLASLATVEVLHNGRLPLSVMARIGAAFARLALPGGKAEAVLDHLHREMVGMLPDGRDQFGVFFAGIGSDQALLPQLTPEGIDLFNASTADRDTVRYGCVVSCAPRPSLRAHFRLGRSPYAHSTYEIFRWLHGQVAGMSEQYLPELTPGQRDALGAGYGDIPGVEENDGIVPTRSQVRGTILHAARCDHLDVIGHFGDERHLPPHHDWICSAANFDRRAFERLWSDVVQFILRS
jgi:pimeloyl-ACP methyl ester carboxylesterase